MGERKERHFDKKTVEICRNCQGTGRVIPTPCAGPNPGEQIPIVCPVCRGSGRVKKTKNIKITIEPYPGKSGV